MTAAAHAPSTNREQDAKPGGERNMLLLWTGQFVNTAGLMMLVPIMPFYLEQIGTSTTAETQTWAGVAIAAPALALTVATPLWGRLGDRIGRKWMVVRALLGLAAAMVVMAAADTPLALVVGRLLQGTLGGVVEAAAAFAGAAGSDRTRGSSLGKSFSATAAGALAGPVAGGLFVGSGGLRELMLVIAAAAVALAIACAAGLREPRVPRATTARRDPVRTPPVSQVPGAAALAFAAIAVHFGVYGLIPVYAEHVAGVLPDRDIASAWVGVLHSVMWGATLLGSFWWGRHNDGTGRPLRTFAVAAAGCAVAIALLSLPLDPYAMLPVRLVQGFCFAALAQSLFLHFSKHAPEERRSSHVSTANSWLLIGQSAGPLLAGPMTGLLPVSGSVLVMALACALGALLAALASRAERRGPDESPPESEITTRIRVTEPVRTGVAAVPFRGGLVVPPHLSALAARYATPWSPDQDAATWRRSVVQDRLPAFYAYEQHGPHGHVRGVLASVHLDSGLHAPEELVPDRVGSMVESMRAQGWSLAPALVGFAGDGRATALMREAATRDPDTEVRADDGSAHRLWRITEHEAQDSITSEIGAGPAFLAEGHHRHAAAVRYRRAAHAAGRGPGPWDYFPALLVDTTATPLRITPIHRVLPGADPRRVLRAAANHFRVQALGGDPARWITALKRHGQHGPSFVVATASGGYLLDRPHPGLLESALREEPARLRGLHVTVLNTALIKGIWQFPDDAHHREPSAASAARAVRHVQRSGGIAVLTSSPSTEEVTTAAREGVRLPAGSVSFGPEPHPGLVFRNLERT
ncbi:MFS transporter [Saccharopolyspora sp. ID03-671]|uniref:MFS transporter n=1 Tax=Saccharopolyspora sp. ID03-671 TaxID=3073066 RepID=UPI0032553449